MACLGSVNIIPFCVNALNVPYKTQLLVSLVNYVGFKFEFVASINKVAITITFLFKFKGYTKLLYENEPQLIL